jgi:Ran GTPase-activating protein (RanGAP) involved in mRNA processing and transport
MRYKKKPIFFFFFFFFFFEFESKKMVHPNVEEAISQMRRGVTELKPYVFLVGKKLGVDDARAIAAELPVNVSLTTLNLNGNSICDAGATSLAEALRVNTTLAVLNLRKTSIGAAGGASLAAALRVNSALTELNLWNNSIGDAGAASLAEALKVNTALMELNLAGNSISNAGATSLAGALGVNSALTSLDLGRNPIGNAGAASFALAIGANVTLRRLNLRSVSLTVECSAALVAAVESSQLAVPISPAQRLAFFTGHLRRPSQQSPLTKLPLDMVRRILTRYKVAQGRRVWVDGEMFVVGPG